MLSSKLFRVASLGGGSQFNGSSMRSMSISIMGHRHHRSNVFVFGDGGRKNYCSPAGGDQEIIVTVENGVRQILLNRPKKYNSITKSCYNVMINALEEANTDANTKVVILTGAGNFFCAGNDLETFDAMITAKFFERLIDLEKPIIGLINGPAIGLGVTSCALFDAVFASDRATFHTPFTMLGICPEGCSSYTFPKIMGYAKANQFLLFNKQFTAQEAYTAGLITAVIPHVSFREEALKIVKGYAKLPLNSLVYSKALVRNPEKAQLHRANKDECDRLVERHASDDCKQAVANFYAAKEKMSRKPKK